MSKNTRYLGLDVHGETIAAAIAEGNKVPRSLGLFPNRPESVRKFIDKLGGPGNLKVCYEAGPTGYALYWQLTKNASCDRFAGDVTTELLIRSGVVRHLEVLGRIVAVPPNVSGFSCAGRAQTRSASAPN